MIPHNAKPSGLRSRSRTLLAYACGVCLSACASAPAYQAPVSALSPLPRLGTVAQLGAPLPAPPLERWWLGFQDPALTRIIERALAQNLEIQAALERVAQARAVAQGAGAAMMPQADAALQGLRERQSLQSPIGALASTLPGFERNASLYDAGIGASWEIDLSGGLRHGEQAAQAEMQAAQAMQAGVRISVAADAADAYFQIRADQAERLLRQQLLAVCAKRLALARQKQQQGLAAASELAPFEVALAQTQGALSLLHLALEAQYNRLDVLMGAQPGSYAAELHSAAPLAQVPRISDGPTDWLRRRPDIIAAERRLAASHALVGVALAEYYPQLSLSAVSGFESLSPGHLFSASTFQPTALAGLRWRLFDFGKIDAEVAQANAARRAALLDYRQTVLRAAEDVENSSEALLQRQAYAATVTTRVAALRRAHEDAILAYRAGLTGSEAMLDTDSQYLLAEQEQAHAQADSARAAVSLFRALGGGW